jgi:hypothetical protein
MSKTQHDSSNTSPLLHHSDQPPHPEQDSPLPPVLRQLHSAIWLIGLAILFWQGWIWPGILVLIALSTLVEASLKLYARRRSDDEQLSLSRAQYLPSNCPHCGGPLAVETVKWVNHRRGLCPFCGVAVKAAPARPSAD